MLFLLLLPYQYLIIVGCWIPIAQFGGYRYGPNTGGGGAANYADSTITIAYEVRVNGQCVKNVPYSDLSIARVFGVKFCEIRSALPLAVKFVQR